MIADDLIEMDFGAFEGIAARDLITLESYKEWINGGFDASPPNGETGRQVFERSISVIRLIIQNMMDENISHAAVVSHAGVIANILSACGIPRYKPMELQADFGEGFEVIISAMMWQNTGTFELLGRIPGSDDTSVYW
jgi:alpha-ribazole phosphatase